MDVLQESITVDEVKITRTPGLTISTDARDILLGEGGTKDSALEEKALPESKGKGKAMMEDGGRKPDGDDSSKNDDGPNKNDEAHRRVRALNALMSKNIYKSNDKILQVGANRFFLRSAYQSIGVLDTLRGYFTSVRPGRDGFLLNVNTTTGAFFRPGMTVSDFMAQVQGDWKLKESMLREVMVRRTYDFDGPPRRIVEIQRLDQGNKWKPSVTRKGLSEGKSRLLGMFNARNTEFIRR